MARSVSYPSNAVVVFDRYEGEDEWDWDDYLSFIIYDLKRAYPSLERCDEWLGREDQAIMENDHAYFGVSEYMGLVSIWAVPKEWDGWGDDVYGLREHWVASIADGFRERFGSLEKVGNASNGEGFYSPKPGSPALQDNLEGPLIINGVMAHGVYAA